MDMRKYNYWKDRRLLGRIRTLKRMIDKRKERIETNKLEIEEYQKELILTNKKLKTLTDLYEPNVVIKKVKVGKYDYWRGDVRFFGRDMGFQIGKEEDYKSRSKEYWIKDIQKRFRKKITDKELEGYIDNIK